MLSREEVTLLMKKREEEGDLWDRRVLGYPVWSLDRFRWHRQSASSKTPASSIASSQPKGWKRLQAEYHVVNQSLLDLRRGGPVERADRDIWILGNSTYRRKDPSGESHCIFAADLREQLGERVLFLEFNGARIPSLNREDHLFLDAYQVPLLLGSRSLSSALAPVLGLTQRQDIQHFAPLSPGRVVDRALYGKGLLALGRRWLRQGRPKAVFVLCGYTMHTPLQIACKEAGVPVIELQHGLITPSHPGYALPKTRGNSQMDPSPDHMVVFGDLFGTILEEASPYWKGRWTSGGHPWLRRKSQGGGVEGSTKKRRPRVLLFSQYEPEIRNAILEATLGLRLRLPEEWEVWLKPHPREFDAADFYLRAEQAGVKVVETAADSYTLLSEADACVCSASTLALEALAFSCRSLLLPGPWTPLMRRLLKTGRLESAENAEELAELLEKPTGEQNRTELRDEIFGLGKPPLDYAALVEQLSRGASSS